MVVRKLKCTLWKWTLEVISVNSWFLILKDMEIIIGINGCTYIHINAYNYKHTYILWLCPLTDGAGRSYIPKARSSTLRTQTLASKNQSPPQ